MYMYVKVGYQNFCCLINCHPVNEFQTDTYVELSRSLGSDATFHPVYRTELVFKTSDPR